MMVFGGKFLIVLLFMKSWLDDLLFLSFLAIDRMSSRVVSEAAGGVTGKGDETIVQLEEGEYRQEKCCEV